MVLLIKYDLNDISSVKWTDYFREIGTDKNFIKLGLDTSNLIKEHHIQITVYDRAGNKNIDNVTIIKFF